MWNISSAYEIHLDGLYERKMSYQLLNNLGLRQLIVDSYHVVGHDGLLYSRSSLNRHSQTVVFSIVARIMTQIDTEISLR